MRCHRVTSVPGGAAVLYRVATPSVERLVEKASSWILRFVSRFAASNRLKPSGIAAKETILRVHLVSLLGEKGLDTLTTEDVQRLKSALGERSPKTVNNVLTVLSVVLKTAVERGVIERVPCSIKLLKTAKSAASFYDYDECERLVEAARPTRQTYLVVLLGGEAGLRYGELMALEWTDVNLHKRQLCVARSEWKGHVTMPKRGRLRYVPLTKRLTQALRETRHLRGPRVLCDTQGQSLTQKVIQVMVRRAARRASVRPGVPHVRVHQPADAGGGRARRCVKPASHRPACPSHPGGLAGLQA